MVKRHTGYQWYENRNRGTPALDHLQKLIETEKIYNSALEDAQKTIQEKINESINDSYIEALTDCINLIQKLKKR